MNKLAKSFIYAWGGWVKSLEERNMKIHVVAVAVVTTAGVFFQISQIEWVAIALCCGLVISLEMVNSAVEKLCDIVRDHVGLEYHHTRWPRDLAAGSVLAGALCSVVVAGLIFLPRLF